MTKREFAVLVAKDVLKQLRLKKIQAQEWVWFDTAATVGDDPATYEDRALLQPGAGLQKILGELQRPCRVCGLGATLVSYASLCDKVKVGESGAFDLEEDVLPAARKAFDMKTVVAIEFTFEGGYGAYQVDYDGDRDAGQWLSAVEQSACGRIYRKNANDPAARLKAIYSRIIRNKGVFFKKVTA